ncbi:MAG TPA: DUF2809 domain-containing protein [Puia sp.]
MKTHSVYFQFNKKYFLFALLLLTTEILIACYAKDRIIRPYGGDFLVVILLYNILRSFTHLSVNRSCISVLLFSYAVELLQYIHLADQLGLRHSSIPYILLGNYFSWGDMICYTLGIGSVLILEGIIRNGTHL